MARPSRSSKKHPAFDPSELDDLIFSPAVGQGVGSHLISKKPTVVTSIVTPVENNSLAESNIVSQNMATVDRSNRLDVATVDSLFSPGRVKDLSTVDTSSLILKPAYSTENYNDTASLEKTQPPPSSLKQKERHSELVSSSSALASTPIQATTPRMWITEHGDVVPAGRIRRVRLAQDAINSGEECVYDTLWNSRVIENEERDGSRLVQAGYDYLVKRTRLSRKTIQRVVAKLIEKDFIAVETRADIFQRVSTVYRVFNYKTILERNLQKGRTYVAKIGPGFAFAKPFDQSSTDMTTVDKSSFSIEEKEFQDHQESSNLDMTTVVNETTVTVVNGNPTTVVNLTPYLLEQSKKDNTSSSSGLRDVLSSYGQVDDDALETLIRSCRDQAPDCTEEEISAFVSEKGELMLHRKTRVHNPIGFLLTAVPKCFEANGWGRRRQEAIKGREAVAQRAAQEHVEAERWKQDQEALLNDPAVSEQEKHLIRLCLGLNAS